jgi:hypothetical protein
VLTPSAARDLAFNLAREAREGSPASWRAGAARLSACDGRSWLALDDAARSWNYMGGPPVGGTAGWLGESLGEPSGFVAAVTSLHADGRIRQRATKVLSQGGDQLHAAALAVRTLDHVPQVRHDALRGLIPRLDLGTAEPVLDVILAGARRQHAEAALGAVRRALDTSFPLADLLNALMAGDRRHVRRWAFEIAHDRGLLTVGRLIGAVNFDPDQLIRAKSAQWLPNLATPEELQSLLSARSVEARLVALTHLPDDQLPTESLLPMLAAQAPRLREAARWRSRRREVDLPHWYREQLGQMTVDARPGYLAACLDGLAAVGGPNDVGWFSRDLNHDSPKVRRAAVDGVGRFAESRERVSLLVPLLLDASPRVCAVAARVLVRNGAGPAEAAVAWESSQPWSRRAAWWLSRESGSWNRVEADLRLLGDTDPELAAMGQTGIRNWLDTAAARTWARLDDAQRGRIAALLSDGPLDEWRRRNVAFHAGIPYEAGAESEPDTSDDPEASTPRGLLFKFLRRRP